MKNKIDYFIFFALIASGAIILFRDPSSSQSLTFIGILIAIMIYYKQYIDNRANNTELLLYKSIFDNPLVIAKSDGNTSKESWKIINEGKSTGINVLLGLIDLETFTRERFLGNAGFLIPDKLIKISSLDSKEEVVVNWVQKISIIYVLYQNIKGDSFVSVITDNEIRHSEVSKLDLLNFYNDTLSFGRDSYEQLISIQNTSTVAIERELWQKSQRDSGGIAFR